MSIATLSTLEQANFTSEQARALTKVFEEDHQNLATKDDIKSLEAKMAADIKFMEAKMATKEETQAIREEIKDIRGDIKSMEARMATKEETQAIREEIKDIRGDIKSLEAKMVTKAELNKINNNMIKWIVTGMFFNMGVLYMLFKYLDA